MIFNICFHHFSLAPHKNEIDEENINPQVDTIKKHLFDSPIPNPKKEASVSGISDEKLRENEMTYCFE